MNRWITRRLNQMVEAAMEYGKAVEIGKNRAMSEAATDLDDARRSFLAQVGKIGKPPAWVVRRMRETIDSGIAVGGQYAKKRPDLEYLEGCEERLHEVKQSLIKQVEKMEGK